MNKFLPFLHPSSFLLSSFCRSFSRSSMPAIVHLIPEEESATAQYVVACPTSKKCAIIDSVLGYDLSTGRICTKPSDKLIDLVKEKDYHVDWILDTHIHADHITGMNYLKTKFPEAKSAIGAEVVQVQEHFVQEYSLPHESIKGSFFDVLFQDDQEFHIGEMCVKAIHSPGHTPADLSYYILDDCVFTGDSIFMPDMGTARCDFPRGCSETLWNSLQKILSLPESVRVFVGHDYKPGSREYQSETTVKEQKLSNIHVKDGSTKDEFVHFRSHRDKVLGLPRLFHASVQFNIRGGAPPLPELNGTSFVRVPINFSC